MPLNKRCGPDAFRQNMRFLMYEEGRPHRQALAISLDVQRRQGCKGSKERPKPTKKNAAAKKGATAKKTSTKKVTAYLITAPPVRLAAMMLAERRIRRAELAVIYSKEQMKLIDKLTKNLRARK